MAMQARQDLGLRDLVPDQHQVGRPRDADQGARSVRTGQAGGHGVLPRHALVRRIRFVELSQFGAAQHEQSPVGQFLENGLLEVGHTPSALVE